jgi:hypothetical protein
VLRFTCSVFPSEDDDVVTSPYNSMLALDRLLDSAHCVFPVENQALADIAGRAEAAASRQGGRGEGAVTGGGGAGKGARRGGGRGSPPARPGASALLPRAPATLAPAALRIGASSSPAPPPAGHTPRRQAVRRDERRGRHHAAAPHLLHALCRRPQRGPERHHLQHGPLPAPALCDQLHGAAGGAARPGEAGRAQVRAQRAPPLAPPAQPPARWAPSAAGLPGHPTAPRSSSPACNCGELARPPPPGHTPTPYTPTNPLPPSRTHTPGAGPWTTSSQRPSPGSTS